MQSWISNRIWVYNSLTPSIQKANILYYIARLRKQKEKFLTAEIIKTYNKQLRL